MHEKDYFVEKCRKYLKILTVDIEERCVGSEGNRKATNFIKDKLESFGINVETQGFEAMDWLDNGVDLFIGDENFEAFVSPYSIGCNVEAELASVGTIKELRKGNYKGKILLIHGELAKEQLMPKNFKFYNPKLHQEIISILENSNVLAVIAATGRNPATTGGLYPFPLIEDGDFNIPSVYMKDIEGERLIKHVGKKINLKSISKRIYGKGYNVIGKINEGNKKKIVITAHIDSKKNSPGAIDNATGVASLILLGEMLNKYEGNYQIDIVALNGEDYFAYSGQMKYFEEIQNNYEDILLNINIDGAGYKKGKTAISLYDVSDVIKEKLLSIMENHEDIIEGKKWYQGDHSIFIQNNCPAIAVTSNYLIENMGIQKITHTKNDNIYVVDCLKIVDMVNYLYIFLNIIN